LLGIVYFMPGAEAGRGGKLETLGRQTVRASECLGKLWERLPPNSLVQARFTQVLAHMIQVPQRFPATDDTVS